MAKAKTNTLDTTAEVLTLVGGLNWGLTALGYNVVNMLAGSVPALETTVYGLVGLSALYLAYTWYLKK